MTRLLERDNDELVKSEPDASEGRGCLLSTKLLSPQRLAQRFSADHPAEPSYAIALSLTLVLSLFVLAECFVPLKRNFQIGIDEGMELAKATLCAKGYHLYSQVWNDQPPLHTFLVSSVLKYISWSILMPRLLTVGFALVLLASIFAMTLRINGLFVAVLTSTLVVASPGFIVLSSSCMLEVPALAVAVAGLGLLVIGAHTRGCTFEVLSGVLFAVALQMKLVPMILLPLAAGIIWWRHREREHPIRNRFISGVALLSTVIVCFIALDLLIERGAYLIHFHQSWASHFGAAKSSEYGSAEEHVFDWTVLLRNWDTSIPAAVGAIVIFKKSARKSSELLPIAWLALSLLVFVNHRPWWPYYYIHIAVPLCWCAALGIRALIRLQRAALITVILFSLCGLPWLGARLGLEVIGLRRAPQPYFAVVLNQIKRLHTTIRYMFADDPIYSFYAGIPMPPQLAVLPQKRFWAGEMDNQRVAAEMLSVKPEIVLLRNDGREVPFQRQLDSEYRLAYLDPQNRLYVSK